MTPVLLLTFLLWSWSAAATTSVSIVASTREVYTTTTTTTDLRGQMFTVLKGGMFSMYPPTSPSSTPAPVSGLTVCLRYMAQGLIGGSVWSGDPYVFRLALDTYDSLSLRRMIQGDSLSYGGSSLLFHSYKPFWPSIKQLLPWNNLCLTWDMVGGVAQVWRGGTVSLRKYLGQKVFSGPLVFSLDLGRGTQSGFEGQMMDVEVWDKALSPDKIYNYMTNPYYFPGNLLSWSNAVYNNNKAVLLERNIYLLQQPITAQQQTQGPKRRNKKISKGQRGREKDGL